MDIRQTGKFISELRKERKMTQRDLANVLNVTDKAISRWETGRGLPDSDSMLGLSSFFGVTINEILLGRMISAAETEKKEAETAVECLKIIEKKKRLNVWLTVTASVLILAWIIVCAAAIVTYKRVMGSSDCIIAEDYSYIMVFCKKFVPFDTEGDSCVQGPVLIGEAKVENADFFTKLLFSDTIRLVNGCNDADFIYLSSEHNSPSCYYCLEESKEKYKALLDAPKDITVAEIITNDWSSYDVIINTDIVSAISSLTKNDIAVGVDCSVDRSKGEETAVIYEKQSAGPFRRAKGALLCKNGGYYWFDYSDIPYGQNNADYSNIAAYKLPEQLYGELKALFLMMFK